ncbi:hypothetical protein TI05_15450 [Achromatium sp. WMS3]|nr:hypothetical protein TI05_15450 [Achromatium sp. WMS3]
MNEDISKEVIESSKGKMIIISYYFPSETRGYSIDYVSGIVDRVDDEIVVLKKSDASVTYFDYTSFDIYEINVKEFVAN